MYVLSAAAYLAFLWYTLSRFAVGADGTFLALVFSACLFLGLGYLLREREFSPPPQTTRYVIVAVALIGVVFLGADLGLSEVEYEISIHDEAQLDERGEVEIGTITATNQFVFREPIDMPRPLVCAYGFDREVRPVALQTGEGSMPQTVPGGKTVTATITTRFNEEEYEAVDWPIPVETATQCPDDAEAPRLVIVTNDEFPQPPR